MATIKDNVLTMADVVRVAKDPTAGAIIEIMSLTNEIITDAPTQACNDGTTHKTTLRDDIPLPKFRMLNQGVPITKSATRQITEHTGVLENWMESDRETLKLSGNPKQVLASEAKAYLEGMAQGGAEALFYGDHALDAASFTGFTPRYNVLDDTVYPQARNVIDAGGTGIPDPSNPGYTTNLTSIWLIQWDSAGCHLLYPKGTSAGVKQEVFNDQILRDADNNPFPGIMVHYYWYLGLAVRDWRRCVRICNVDADGLTNLIAGGAPTAADYKLLRLMQYATTLLPYKSTGRTMFYMNRIPHTMVDMLSSEKPNVQLNYANPQGTPPQASFLGIPVRRCDGLIIGEPQVV